MTGQDGAGNVAGRGGMPVRDELRRLVREVLRELLPAAAADQRVAGSGAVGAGRPGGAGSGAVGAGRPGGAGSGAVGAGRPDGAVRAVRLTTEEELHAFVVEVLRLADDPQRRIDLLAGRLRFIPAQPAGPRSAAAAPAAPGPAAPGALGPAAPAALGPAAPAGPGLAASAGTGSAIRRIEKGAVTERAVIAAARAGEQLVLGPRAVLTPLARDKARALGVPVEKER